MAVFPTDWDVNKYFDETETKEHWNLRKKFMEIHKTKYPEQRLASLAKLFCNIEFLGCIYSTEVMCLVDQLAKEVGVIVQYRVEAKNKLKRTFVKASNAVKRSHNKETEESSTPKQTKVNYGTSVNHFSEVSDEARGLNRRSTAQTSESTNETVIKKKRDRENFSRDFIAAQSEPSGLSDRLNTPFLNPGRLNQLEASTTAGFRSNNKQNGRNTKLQKKSFESSFRPEIPPLTNKGDQRLFLRAKQQSDWKGAVVLYQLPTETAYTTLQNSFSRAGFSIKCGEDKTAPVKNGQQKHNLMFSSQNCTDDEVVASCYVEKKRARSLLGEEALKEAQKFCFTIVKEELKAGEKIQDVEVEKTTSGLQVGGIGARMMKKMGWTGEGLGRHATGIMEPVLAVNSKKLGFGVTHLKVSGNIDDAKICSHLEEYIRSGKIHPIVLPANLSKEVRARFHKIAENYNLVTKSYGTGEERQLTIRRKLSPWEEVQNLLALGGHSNGYTLIKPSELL